MVSIYQLKSGFQGLLRPLVQKLATSGVTANQVTIAAVLLSFAGGACTATAPTSRWPWLLLPLLLFVRMGLNAIDGMLAREHNMKSKLGAILNEIGDVVSDTALYLPFALLSASVTVILVCILALVSEMMGVVAIQIGASRRYDGPMGKSDRAFVFGAIALFYGIGLLPLAWLSPILGLVALLLILTICNRARSALREASHA
jgi:CDP-diacylglycerol--glycerol-3-phosphate 3-phosphatidyltransferase